MSVYSERGVSLRDLEERAQKRLERDNSDEAVALLVQIKQARVLDSLVSVLRDIRDGKDRFSK